MPDEQLDLFAAIGNASQRPTIGAGTRPVIAWDCLDDDRLIAAILDEGFSDGLAAIAEIARRKLGKAIPALETLCRRFAGFGVETVIPQQAAALDALMTIGGIEASRAVARLVVKRAVQGPTLQQAVGAAARLGSDLPADILLNLLRHDVPQLRADGCRCAGHRPEAIPVLVDLLDDLHSNVRTAAACALGRMGRTEARSALVRLLCEQPSAEILDAITRVADEESIVLLGRVARAAPHLCPAVIDALEAIDHPLAQRLAAAISARADRQPARYCASAPGAHRAE